MKGYFPHPFIRPLRFMSLGGVYLWLYAELLLILLAGTVHSPLLVCSIVSRLQFLWWGGMFLVFIFVSLDKYPWVEEFRNQMVVLFKFGGTSYCFPNDNTNFLSLQLHSRVLFHILISIHSCVVFFNLFWVLLEVLRPHLALLLLLVGFGGNHTWCQG